MLGAICAVTIVVPDLAPIEVAYTELLGFRVIGRGIVSEQAALGWNTVAVAGCRMLLLAPEIGEETCLRFIEDPLAGAVRPFITHGWNATEITVQDTDRLAHRLEGSAFRIIGPPRNLHGFEWIRAMQVLGPAGECLYLTDVGGDASLAPARAMVGQVFIVVVGGPDIHALSDFYRRQFGNPVSEPVEIPIGVINEASGLDAGHRHKLALVELPQGTRIELDQYPDSAVARVSQPGRLAPGMSIVSFLAEPDETTPTRCIIGAAGERIELCSQPIWLEEQR